MEISRWVLCEVICENYHMILLLCGCVIVRVHFLLCVFFFWFVFSQEEEGGDKGKEGQAVAVVVVGGKEIHWPWEMEIVSKTVFSVWL